MQQPDGADVLAQGGAPSKAALMGMAAAKGKAAKQSEPSAPEAAVSPPDHQNVFDRQSDAPCLLRPQWTAWTAEEQSALEKALKSVGKDWDKVAELVEGRSAKECKTRFKELAKAIKAKKAKK